MEPTLNDLGSPASSRQVTRKPRIERAVIPESPATSRHDNRKPRIERVVVSESPASSRPSIVLFPIFLRYTAEVCGFKETTKQDVHWRLRSRLQGELDFRGSLEDQEHTQPVQREGDSKRISVLASNSLISAPIEDIRTRKLV